jgi:hypothetical protein
MKKSVIVTAIEGNVINKSKNNPNYGYIRVEQTRMIVDEMGFARKQTLSALISGTIETLESFGWTPGQEIEGTVVVKESMKPFNRSNPDADLKVAGDTNIICSVNGAPIYRKNFYSTSITAEDVLIAHTNSAEIKAAYGEVDIVDTMPELDPLEDL